MASTEELIARLAELKSKLEETAAGVDAQQQATSEAQASLGGIRSDVEELSQSLANLGAQGSASLAATATSKAEEVSGLLEQTQQLIEQSSTTLRSAGTANDEVQSLITQIQTGALLTTSSPQSSAMASARSAPPSESRHTRPSGPADPDAMPKQQADKHRNPGIKAENSAAIVIAREGYEIVQNPPEKPNGRRPDFLIEGEYWDCYAPTSPDVNTVRKAVSFKVKKGQADRIILDLRTAPVSMDDLKHRFETRPVKNLREVKIISQEGEVVDFFPFDRASDKEQD
ncbi:CdiA C-terminal domain-containing protein [Salininema proteolyticum]|uniref:tRNA nuclease CdiA C-terminal domain-containing protein n=1 Tax=Salininema proteolyticum TaxID=1607685 RepID=A0ABV8TXB6_9ACTN